MILSIVAVRDSAAGAYMRPFYMPSVGLAVRSFQDEVNRDAPDNTMFSHPEDFELYQLGTFDDITGEFALMKAPVSLATAKQLRLKS